MIQIRLKYGNSLFIYGNVNNMDIIWNIPSIIKIASFFDIPESSVSITPKSKYSFIIPFVHSHTSTTEVPQIFTILTYLYTIHPSLSLMNIHFYLPSEVSDLDSSMIVLNIPEIHLRGKNQDLSLKE